MPRATIKEVSQRAGVSVATVSRAFSAPERVRPQTLERVLRVAEEVNFRPNAFARSLRARRSHTVLVMIPDIANPFFSSVVKGIERAAVARGYAVLLGITDSQAAREDELALMIDSQQVDGVIQLNSRVPEAVRQRRARGLDTPFVNACDCVDDDTLDRVMIDNAGAAGAVIRDLHARGHRRIGVIQGPEDSALTSRRRTGCETAAVALPELQLLYARGSYTMASGRIAAMRMLARAANARPTALFCFSDEMAMGAMSAARQAGVSVPSELSIIGFDDIDHAELSVPALTTVSQPKLLLGEQAMTLLLEQIEGAERPARTVIVDHQLIARASVADA